MSVEIPQPVVKEAVRQLLWPGGDYRLQIVNSINAMFFNFVMEFLEEIGKAKIKNKTIDNDWYKTVFMDERLPSNEIAINAGINMKTISNICGKGDKNTVIDASQVNYDSVKQIVSNLVQDNNDMDLTITIKTRSGEIDLDINESLVVINAIAVKRAALRGGIWSSIGKRAEKPLMLALCYLYEVSPDNYAIKQLKEDGKATYKREIDFFLIGKERANAKKLKRFKCEIKLMGRGNPESADAVVARESRVFVADTLLKNTIAQLESLNVEWVALKEENGYRRFATVLENLNIPHKPYDGNLEDDMDEIIEKAFLPHEHVIFTD